MMERGVTRLRPFLLFVEKQLLNIEKVPSILSLFTPAFFQKEIQLFNND